MKNRLVALLLVLMTLPAWASLDAGLLRKLASDDAEEKVLAIQKIAQTADPEALTVLQAMADDKLYMVGKQVLIIDEDRATDASTGKPIAMPAEPESITTNNQIVGELETSIAALKLFDPQVKVRLAAAKMLEENPSAELASLLAKALASEQDAKVKSLLTVAYAESNLGNKDPKARLAAAQVLGETGSPLAKTLLLPLTETATEPDEKVRFEAIKAVKAIDGRLATADFIASAFSGLSLGSILLLAALGLAITYGVMGIINMAHGELLMIGAYATYVVQSIFRTHFPGAIDWYLPAAIPVAFFSAALVGVLMERTVIRWLYGRTLETLLATWGISLVLIQASRVVFGAQNVEVSNPSWMSGGITLLPNLILPWNRIFIVCFALFVLALVWVLMNKTRLGMFIRAVTQNRPMASCVGVPTARIDTMAFALGAGIAGLGGVALSQISNVGPDMGQNYIVDSFMVVVLGGVGQLAGTVWAALGLGVFTKVLETWVGAVIAKILVLVFIIVFIQKRPQGIFALKGRFVE